MPAVAITKVNDVGKKTLLVFEEMAKRIEAIPLRAFDLFEKRGCELGHDVEDWLNAERELLGSSASELVEKDGAYELQVTLPGFEWKDVEVTATPNKVIVHAAKKARKKIENGDVVGTEFGSNEVYRSFELPNSVNVDKVTANLENGILRINAPEIAAAKEMHAAVA
jgi:HSP20 family molecular chaperone IbpA